MKARCSNRRLGFNPFLFLMLENKIPLNPKNELLHPYNSCILKQGVCLFDFGGMGLCSIFSLNPPRYSLLIVE